MHFFSPKEVGKKIPFGGSFSVCEKYLVAQTVKRLPTMRETWVRSLGREDPLEEEMATHTSTLTWKILWTGRLQSMASQRVRHDWATSLSLFHFLSLWTFYILGLWLYLWIFWGFSEEFERHSFLFLVSGGQRSKLLKFCYFFAIFPPLVTSGHPVSKLPALPSGI